MELSYNITDILNANSTAVFINPFICNQVYQNNPNSVENIFFSINMFLQLIQTNLHPIENPKNIFLF